MRQKGRQSKSGVGDIWEQPKKRVSVALTTIAVEGLDRLAKQRELSRSELIERIGREIIKLTDTDS
jgi:metal-responsive CopG/Arc/MetJ family transcriptional regulator